MIVVKLITPIGFKFQQGFTLIEIIFVVFIIGMAVGVIGLTVGGNSGAERSFKEAETFFKQAAYVSEQAILRGETYGLFVEFRIAENEEGALGGEEQWCYQWQRVRDREWQTLSELEKHCLPEEFVLEFTIEKKVWEYDPEREYQDPVIGFFPSGDSSGAADISIYAAQTFSDEKNEPQEFKLMPLGELRWINEEERIEQEKKNSR
jgi:general secretion pathway protein H